VLCYVMQAQQQTATVESLWKTYQATGEWIRFTDTKAGATLAACGVLAGVVAGALKDNRKEILASVPLSMCLALALLALLSAVVYGMNCISPTLGFQKKKGLTRSPVAFLDAKESVIYFEHVAALEKPEDYELVASEIFADAERTRTQVAQQVWALARVCSEKNRQVAWAIRLLAVSLVLFTLAALVGFVGGKP
jgi:hypothetical protein